MTITGVVHQKKAMKTIFLVRHAKSSWEDYSLKDIERPLNERGRRDAPFMGKLMLGKEQVPDLIISSPAKRALTTARIFAEQLGKPKEEVQVIDEIYEAYTTEILYIINALDDRYASIALFGHNPTMTDIANVFGEEYIPNVPTCAIVKIVSSATTWAELDKSNSKRTAFHFPKQYMDK